MWRQGLVCKERLLVTCINIFEYIISVVNVCLFVFKGVKYYSNADHFPLNDTDLWSKDGVSMML